MKTVKDACELQPNALSIKLSDQIEQRASRVQWTVAGQRWVRGRNFTSPFCVLCFMP
jgi:hypothetical protein